MRIRSYCRLAPVLLFTGGAWSASAQNAQIGGFVSDTQKAAIPNASVEITALATQAKTMAVSNAAGIYNAASLPPGVYRLSASAPGFETQVIDKVAVAVAGNLTLDFVLRPGSEEQTVTVDGSGIQMNTTDAAVSSVVDRQFVENLPLNGRSFQSLLTLIPGTEVVPSSGGVGYSGEIAVNGQRTESNYFTVDGVSANTGAAPASSVIGYGAGYGGAVAQETVLGTTQSIVPIEALQEFRASTSTYSAQYGRTPGGQFEFVTRSGTNSLHGNAFDYLRNDVFDANSAINNFEGIAKPRERQNDFGSTLGGPVTLPGVYSGRDRTFFFAAYEGLRLSSPLSAQTDVPTYELRATAAAAMQPFLNAFPLPTPNLPTANGPNGETNEGNGMAIFQSAYSAPSALDNGSLRVDQQLGEKLHLFARYSYTRSAVTGRNTTALSEVEQQANMARAATAGATAFLTPRLVNDLRFNYTASTASSSDTLDTFGGAVPFDTSSVPVLSMANSNLYFQLYYGKDPFFTLTPRTTAQHQINVVDWIALTIGRHALRWGGDYRRLANWESYPSVYEYPVFESAAHTAAGTPDFNYIFKLGLNTLEPTFNNASLFMQDEWKATDRLSLSLGLRWELYPPPGASNGALPYALTSTDLATVALAPRGTPLWHTKYTNFAPRVGLAYQAHTAPGQETTVRVGFGLFYDLPYATALQDYWGTGYMAYTPLIGRPFPATEADYENSPSPSAGAPYNSITYGFDPNLRTPYTMEWNAALEQGLGRKQSLLVNYVSSAGRRLLANLVYDPTVAGNTRNFIPTNDLYLTDNVASSGYNALQVRLDRKMARGLQAFLSYTWSHAIDNDTSDFQSDQLFRGSSDYDIRSNFQAAVTYDLPGSFASGLLREALAHWSLDSRVTARSALPVNVIDGAAYNNNGVATYFYPNRVTGQPLYLSGPQYAGGRTINYSAFSLAQNASGPVQGDFGRNGARGFDAVQADLAARKDFTLHENIGLTFRAEAFNVLNHPIWGTIYNQLSTGPQNFGRVYTTQNTQLGGLSALYQTGGPRSLQLALKLHF